MEGKSRDQRGRAGVERLVSVVVAKLGGIDISAVG